MRVLTQCSVWYNIPLQKPRQHKRLKGRERERKREREFRCGWRASERECVLYRSIIELLWGPASRPWRANGGHPGDDLEISWGIGSTKSRSDEVGRRRNENVCYIGRLLKLSGVPRRAPGGPMGVTHETILRYLGALEVLNLVPMRLEGIGTRMCAISVDY